MNRHRCTLSYSPGDFETFAGRPTRTLGGFPMHPMDTTPRPAPTPPDAPPAEALRYLVDEHAAQIYALGLRFCGNPTDAEDMVQEVFLHAFRAWDTFRGDSSVKTWLYTIAARACQRMHRPRAGQPKHIGSIESLLPFGERTIGIIPTDQPDAVQHQIQREARERIEAAIVELPDEFRVPVILKEIVGFSVPEVAQILGLQPNTVRSRIHRARLKLRAAVDGAIPRAPHDAPPPAYPESTCLDLLNAKQEALDRGVTFDNSVICERCRSVFASLDLAHEACAELSTGDLPPGLRERLSATIADRAG